MIVYVCVDPPFLENIRRENIENDENARNTCRLYGTYLIQNHQENLVVRTPGRLYPGSVPVVPLCQSLTEGRRGRPYRRTSPLHRKPAQGLPSGRGPRSKIGLRPFQPKIIRKREVETLFFLEKRKREKSNCWYLRFF